MKKKTFVIIVSVFAVISIFLCINVWVQDKTIHACTCTELESRGYKAEDVSCIRIDHSYIRRILGYKEWRISVAFEKEPDVFFWFAYKNSKLIYQGVSSDPMMEPDAAVAYSEKFKNGTLLSELPPDN